MSTSLEKRKIELAAKKENEIWLYSYADLITNLLAFFLMLLVASNAGPSASQKIQQSISNVTRGGNRVVTADEEFATYVAQVLADQGLTNNVTVDRQNDGVNLVFSGGIFFESSSAQLTSEATALLASLEPVFKKIPRTYHIDVEGHADSAPIHNQIFPSNWELSAARAGSVVRHLASVGIAPNQMRVVGYSDTRHAGTDLQSNRRVVISISRRQR